MARVSEEKDIPGGVVHDLPSDFLDALRSDQKALVTWGDITPLARNEWICWVESAKSPRPGASASIGAARAWVQENAGLVAGPAAPTANLRLGL